MIYNDENYELLLPHGPVARFGTVGCLPRTTLCGSRQAEAMGLVRIPDDLEPVPEADWKEVIAECHREKIFPMYHRRASKLQQKPTQNGLNYCWSWGLKAAMENARLLEHQPEVDLAAVSIGWTVNWRNAGNYLESALNAVRTRGMCSSEFVPNQHILNPERFKAGWEEDALKYRLQEAWDGDRSAGVKSAIGQALAILKTGRTLYVAHNWWGHALTVEGMEWDETQLNNIVWDHFNSHADGSIQLAGQKGVPDEFYGIRAMVLSA